jgi:hypothetical protein
MQVVGWLVAGRIGVGSCKGYEAPKGIIARPTCVYTVMTKVG